MQPRCRHPQCRSQLLGRSPPQQQAESSGEGAQISTGGRWAREGRRHAREGVCEPDASPARLHLLNRNYDLDRVRRTGDTWLGATGRQTDRQQGGKTGLWSLCLTEAASLAGVSPDSGAPAAGWVPPATSEASAGCNINAVKGSDTVGAMPPGQAKGNRGQYRVASSVGQYLCIVQGALEDMWGPGYEEQLEKVLAGTRMLSDIQRKAQHRPLSATADPLRLHVSASLNPPSHPAPHRLLLPEDPRWGPEQRSVNATWLQSGCPGPTQTSHF